MIVIGHRGAKGLVPENTIASLQKALAHSVNELEFDLRVTKDGIVILHHDAAISHVTDKALPIATTSYSQLKLHKPDLATFQEVVDTIGHSVPLLVEVKRNVPIQPIVKIIKQQLQNGWDTNAFMLGSFSQKTLRELHQELPEIQKVVIESWSGVRARIRARQVATKRLNMRSWWLWSGFLSGMHRRGYQICAYTLNDPVKARKWAKYGLYGVITDYPDRFEK